MDDETKARRRRNFDAIANDPLAWRFTADNLDQAADLLEPHFSPDPSSESDHTRSLIRARIRGPLLMLRGCALECLLKALYVAKDNRLGQDGHYALKGVKDHDLVSYADKATFPLSRVESALLAYLGYFIMQGRYPMPKRAPKEYMMRADGTRRNAGWTAQDERDYHAFRSRLRAEVVRQERIEKAKRGGPEEPSHS